MTQVVLNTDTPQPTLQEAAAALDAAAAAKSAAAPSATPDPNRPDWLPESFKSVDDFKKSYDDGRGELTRLQQEIAELKKGKEPPATQADPNAPPAKTPEELANATPDAQAKAAQDALAKTDLDIKPFQDEFAKTGDISTESRGKIAEALKAQFGENAPALVSQFIEGQKAQVTAVRAQAFEVAGGEQQYAEMVKWAGTGMKPAEVQAFNKAVEQSDVNTALLAIRGLRASYEAARGRQPNLIQGDGSAPQDALGAFASARQMTDAINDPRYATDPAYRNQVATRIMKSNY